MQTNSLERLREIIAQLRDPKTGCPWDQAQTHASLTPYVIEEAYEVAEAISEGPKKLEEELGDLLLQIYLHSQIGEEQNLFSIESVAEKLCEKLIRRHPHVFANVVVSSAQEVKQNWEKIKREERGKDVQEVAILDSIPTHLPALLESSKIGEKVAPRNFDWDSVEEVLAKVQEELDELRAELDQKKSSPEKTREELGDLLFSMSQLARKLTFNPEIILKEANSKFRRRFALLEQAAQKRFPGTAMEAIPRKDLEQLWDGVKREEYKN